MISERFTWIPIHVNPHEIIDFKGFSNISDIFEPVSSCLNIEINVFVLKIIQNQGFQENSEGVSSHGMGVAKDADIAGVALGVRSTVEQLQYAGRG